MFFRDSAGDIVCQFPAQARQILVHRNHVNPLLPGVFATQKKQTNFRSRVLFSFRLSPRLAPWRPWPIALEGLPFSAPWFVLARFGSSRFGSLGARGVRELGLLQRLAEPMIQGRMIHSTPQARKRRGGSVEE